MTSPTISPARCSRCSVVFGAHGWQSLELVERIGSERVREFVTIWPDDRAIEVRRCACGLPIARVARRDQAA